MDRFFRSRAHRGADPAAGHAAPSREELGKLAQNPAANLISASFQNNSNFNIQAPTNGNDRLGNDHSRIGADRVGLDVQPDDMRVFGALANNVWSLGLVSDPSYKKLLPQPLVNYHLPGGVCINWAPAITANWKADNSQREPCRSVPAWGRIFNLGLVAGELPLGAYYKVLKTDSGAHWQVRFQMQFTFPK
jgi:hypothetical protein